jgi:hypothetical protein
VRSAGHSEIAAKLLTDLGADFHVFSEQALILQGNLSDFDSAIRTLLPLINGRADRFKGIPPGHERPPAPAAHFFQTR